uniref:Uncharacterized protein n=1 Tax=Caulerpa verticillata TaxID=177082 RepID=A0A386B0C0_9CHLO|nr:hypothetical protein [Caulerpa verticillata]AYC65148.1 hypothetical protein [Caulerpa verticillata]
MVLGMEKPQGHQGHPWCPYIILFVFWGTILGVVNILGKYAYNQMRKALDQMVKQFVEACEPYKPEAVPSPKVPGFAFKTSWTTCSIWLGLNCLNYSWGSSKIRAFL